MTLRVVTSIMLAIAALSAAPSGPWHLTSSDTGRYFPPTLGNGHIGVVVDPSGLAPQAVYNYDVCSEGDRGAISSIRQSVIPVSLQLLTGGDTAIHHRSQTLSMDKAAVTTLWHQDGLLCSATSRVLRHMPGVMLTTMRLEANRPVTVTVVNTPRMPHWMNDADTYPHTVWCEDGGIKLMRSEALYNDRRHRLAAASALRPLSGDWQQPSADTLTITLRKGQSAELWAVGAQCSSTRFADPVNEADRQTIYALRQGLTSLIARHEAAWHDLWRGRVEIEGDGPLALLVNSALYNLYCSLRAGSRLSIPPMGLTSEKYYGHIFWDADTWILPVMAVINPDLARSMIDYRVDRLQAARTKASAYGYRGAMFPWESDSHGEESTPTFALTGPLEHHITADVAIAAWLYYCATGNLDWLRSEGYPLLKECADFWVSRLEPTDDDPEKLTVRNVVGADEYAIGIDGDAFTNAAACRALEHAAEAARSLGLSPDTTWIQHAAAIRLPMMDDGIVYREHETYDGAQTKQADVELLAYPLNVMTDTRQIERNIDYYAPKIDSVGGPAMSHSAMAVNYVRINRPDKAAEMLRRATEPYIRGPFLSFSETPGNDETYFMTAAGGLLQAVIFGYGGIQITGQGITATPPRRLPATIRSVKVFRNDTLLNP